MRYGLAHTQITNRSLPSPSVPQPVLEYVARKLGFDTTRQLFDYHVDTLVKMYV